MWHVSFERSTTFDVKVLIPVSFYCLGTLVDGEPIIKLPPKTIHLTKVDFSTEERAFYTKLEADSRSRFKVLIIPFVSHLGKSIMIVPDFFILFNLGYLATSKCAISDKPSLVYGA
jgi:hypothetical protein